MVTPVDPSRFFADCRAALRSDRYVMDAISKTSVTNQVRDIASKQAMRKLAPVFQHWLNIERYAVQSSRGQRSGVIHEIVAPTLASLTGARELHFKRTEPLIVVLGILGGAVGYGVGSAELLGMGALATIIGGVAMATSKPVPVFNTIDFDVVRALASDPPAAPVTAAASHEDAYRARKDNTLRDLNTLIVTTNTRGAGPNWIPFDTPYQFGALTLPRGGFYVGNVGPDAELAIDPRLDFTLTKPDWLGKGLDYWPRYAKLTPEERGTFLAFLHSPRRAGGVAVGYVFLYFYQLELRVVRDAGKVPADEGRALIDELTGLLEAYASKSASIVRYLPELLGVAYSHFPQHVPHAPITQADWSTAQKIAFAAAAERGPLSAEWAFAWASSFHTVVNGAAWQPMRETVRDLFAERYAASPLASRVLKKPRSKLRIHYRWAAFTGSRVDSIPCNWADFAGAESQAIPYQALLQAVCEDLESMRRLRRAEAPAGASLAAAPVEIARKSVTPKLAQWAAAELAAIRAGGVQRRNVQQVAQALGWIGAAKFGKREATQLAQALQALGLGMEPDPRFGGATPKSDTDLALFELPHDAARAPSSAYTAAHLMVTAAASIGGVDGLSQPELNSALVGITSHFQLAPAERARLQAALTGSAGQPVRATAVANRVKTLPEEQRHALAAVLVDIALADGHVSPAEIKLLEKFYGALGLAPATLHADLHHGSLGAKKAAAPAPGTAPASKTVTVAPAFDADAIAQKLEETARVQSMLAEIFVDDSSTPTVDSHSLPAAGDADIHAAALQLVAALDSLDRAAWEAFCETRDLMPDAALEALNEWSLEHTGEVLLDGEDPLDVNTYARDQLAATATP
jgi:tellurite resistance protein